MVRENQRYFNRLQVFLDLIMIPATFFMAYYTRFYILEGATFSLSFNDHLVPVLCAVPFYFALYSLFDIYTTRRTKSLAKEISAILKTNVIAFLVLTLALFLFKMINYSRMTLFIFFIFNTFATSSMRIVIRLTLKSYRAKGYNLKHCLVVGTTTSSIAFINKTRRNPHWGYHIVGVVKTDANALPPSSKADLTWLTSDEAAAAVCEESSLDIAEGEVFTTLDIVERQGIKTVQEYFYGHKVLGSTEDLDKILNDTSAGKPQVDIVLIGVTGYDLKELGHILYTCEKSGVKTNIIPYYHKYIPAKPYMDDLDGLPVIDTRHVPLDNLFKSISKRSLDIVFSLTVILLLSPIYLFSALMVRLSSRGPIIFKQERVGLNRKCFNMYKFRSMRVQTEEDEKDKWTTKNDPRKTWWGNFMRKTSLDELPQFFNVLKGDMSVVGPRPERPFFVDKFKENIPRYMIKHQVRPGITGWAQINGFRGDTSIEGRIEHDLYYIENWSFSFDIKIIFLTVFKGFVNKNAY